MKNAVSVNFQTSGTVAQVMADFNQKVRKSQPLATLDKTLLKLTVQSAQANLLTAENQLTQAQKNYDDTKSLFDDKFKSRSDLDTAKINLDTARVNLQTSRITLDQAKANLNYAVIYSPIDGIVIERNIDTGQTVASSEYRTTLTTNFLLASDTSKMQIFATVDENDISRVKTGQEVNFTVQSYHDKNFSGKVNQVRLQSVVVDNVVNYTVVVDAGNPDHFLIPGMTATLTIITDSRRNILKVPNTALKFQPQDDMIKEMFKKLHNLHRSPNGIKTGQFSPKSANRGTLWTYDEKNQILEPIFVKTGLNDGQMTEISEFQDKNGSSKLDEGIHVLTGVASGSGNAKNSSQKSMLNSVGGPGGGPGPGGPPPM